MKPNDSSGATGNWQTLTNLLLLLIFLLIFMVLLPGEADDGLKMDIDPAKYLVKEEDVIVHRVNFIGAQSP